MLTTTIGRAPDPTPEPEDGVRIRVLRRFTGNAEERARYADHTTTPDNPNPMGIEPGTVMVVTEERAAELCDRDKPLAARVAAPSAPAQLPAWRPLADLT